MSSVARRMLSTFALAETFGMPLTAFEAWKWLFYDPDSSFLAPASRVPLRNVLGELAALERAGVLAQQDGYYTFSDRRELVEERLWHLAIAATKLARAQRWARWIARTPYVRGVFAYGSLATGNTREESDLDVFIVTEPGRIFTARFLASLLTEMFGIRRTRTKVRDRICLNHYVTASSLAFPYRSVLSAWLWARIFPLAARDPSLALRFVAANAWAAEYFPNIRETGRFDDGQADFVMTSEQEIAPVRPRFVPRGMMRTLGDLIERFLRTLQLVRIRRNPLTHKPGGRVVADDAMLIFHPELPEAARTRRFHARLGMLGLARLPGQGPGA
ncbi:MAG: nucleotidyltransferase domain-containing protein [Candidatus Terrybacteria bacterium]|nr:nucleotidyltransferase domain-containing protein [Candidatus Terrybacteria bacterium]